MKILKNLLLLFVGVGIGIAISWHIYYNYVKPKAETNSQILLSHIQKVAKLVTVEAQFNNVFDHKEYNTYDWWLFQKKAILKVNANVAAGVDLEQMDFEIDELRKTLTVYKIPQAEILSIETDVKYFDISEGIFNSFSEEEFTEMNHMAKELIRLNAYNSEVLQQAETKALEVLDLLKLLAASAGWELVLKQDIKQ